jgi:hypothetical protein
LRHGVAFDALSTPSLNGSEWLLVEAKAHLRELDQACAAKCQNEGGSREVICGRLDEVNAAVAPGDRNEWLAHYHQFANRLATLWFLLDHGIETRLLRRVRDRAQPEALRASLRYPGASACAARRRARHGSCTKRS